MRRWLFALALLFSPSLASAQIAWCTNALPTTFAPGSRYFDVCHNQKTATGATVTIDSLEVAIDGTVVLAQRPTIVETSPGQVVLRVGPVTLPNQPITLRVRAGTQSYWTDPVTGSKIDQGLVYDGPLTLQMAPSGMPPPPPPPPPPPSKYTVIFVDSEDLPGYARGYAVDGRLDTMWHTQWATAQPPYPHEIQID